MSKRALITGISGQDGAYLSKLLLQKGYEVFGAQRRGASSSTWRLEELGVLGQIELVPFEMLEYSNILRTIEKVRPDEIYNLAAQSFVAIAFEQPLYTAEVNAMGAARLLEVVRTVNPKIRVYQASTSEMFGQVQETPQTERTPFYPRSPYGVAKLYAHWMTVNYRESYGMHVASGILFNHESPMRGEEFVTRKITLALAKIRNCQQELLELGNLDAKRDWGFAGDYVAGMWRMLQQDRADDFVLATGQTHTVRSFVERAAEVAGFDIEWQGAAENTQGVDRKTGRTIVRVNPAFYRPAEVEILCGDASKARDQLGWLPRVGLDELAGMMMEADLERVATDTSRKIVDVPRLRLRQSA
jgi:GDPmannose 4,6-dehydratase